MRPLKKKVSITIDEDLIEELKALADACDRSFSQYVNIVLKEHVSTDYKNDKSILTSKPQYK